MGGRGGGSGRPPFSCVQHNQVGNFINTSRLGWSGRDRFSHEAAGREEEGEEEVEDEERRESAEEFKNKMLLK